MTHTRTLRRSVAASLAAALALSAAACGTSGDSAGDATTTTKAKAPTTTTEAKAGGDLQEVIDAYIGPLYQLKDEWQDASVARMESTDAAAGIAATRDMRTAVYDFDGELRDMEFPKDLSSEVNDLLEANGDLIAKLDAFNDAADDPALLQEVYDDQQSSLADWQEAADALAEALDIPTVTLRIDVQSGSGEGGGDDPSPTTRPSGVPSGKAGERFELNVFSLVIADGWKGTGGVVDGPGDVMVSGGRLSDASGTLSDVARDSSEGAADKSDYTIEGQPERAEVAGMDALEVRMTGEDDYLTVDRYFQADGEYYVISLDGDADDVADALDDFEEMLDTLEVL
jgi:hypothetical protein